MEQIPSRSPRATAFGNVPFDDIHNALLPPDVPALPRSVGVVVSPFAALVRNLTGMSSPLLRASNITYRSSRMPPTWNRPVGRVVFTPTLAWVYAIPPFTSRHLLPPPAAGFDRSWQLLPLSSQICSARTVPRTSSFDAGLVVPIPTRRV